EKHSAKLLWMPPYWEPGLSGFNVKRRAPGKEWATLNERPILPTLFADDMDTRTNDPALRKSLRKQLASVEKSIADQVRPLDEVIQQLGKSERMDYRKGAARAKYSQALMFGFAFQDERIPRGDAFEYALFGVNRDGSES